MKYREALENLRIFEDGTTSRAHDLVEAIDKAWDKIFTAVDVVDFDELREVIEAQMEEIQYAYECYQEDEEARQESQELVDELEAKEA